MKRVAIVQSCYIPWKGYFDLIAAVDEFILYEDIQYTKRDWRSRNQIKTPQGVQWLTVPVKVKGKYHQTIRETEIDGVDWAEKHWKTIIQNYSRAPHFKEVAALFEPLYLNHQYTHLSALNRKLIEAACDYLGITTEITTLGTTLWLMASLSVSQTFVVKPGARNIFPAPLPKITLKRMFFSIAVSSLYGSITLAMPNILSFGENSPTMSLFLI